MSKILALDLSLTAPGFCVLEITGKGVNLIEVIHIKTDSKQTRGERLQHIEFALTKFVNKHKPFDYVVREDFQSPNSYTNKTTYSVWGVSDLVLARFGYTFDDEINPKSVKKIITGSGKAEKSEVAESVRKLLNLKPTFQFQKDDESDACAIGLAYLLDKKIIDKE